MSRGWATAAEANDVDLLARPVVRGHNSFSEAIPPKGRNLSSRGKQGSQSAFRARALPKSYEKED